MSNSKSGAASGGAIYALGIFGAWVWFFGQAHSFWTVILAFFQGIFWPAWMVYDIFRIISH
jgi:predicted outer membrane repeat protein